MSNKPRVYLAGPIKSLTYAGATSWRELAKEMLADYGIDGISPMRGKQYLIGATSVGQDALKDEYKNYPLSTNKAILSRDFMDCTKSDLILVNLLGAKSVSMGTVLEIGWAHQARVPVVVVIEDDGSNPHEHGMLMECCNFRVNSLNEAISVTAHILLP
jgi:nucleoside 2-deoxyribosyltransferase